MLSRRRSRSKWSPRSRLFICAQRDSRRRRSVSQGGRAGGEARFTDGERGCGEECDLFVVTPFSPFRPHHTETRVGLQASANSGCCRMALPDQPVCFCCCEVTAPPGCAHAPRHPCPGTERRTRTLIEVQPHLAVLPLRVVERLRLKLRLLAVDDAARRARGLAPLAPADPHQAIS